MEKEPKWSDQLGGRAASQERGGGDVEREYIWILLNVEKIQFPNGLYEECQKNS